MRSCPTSPPSQDPLASASSASGLTLPGSFAASPGGEDEQTMGAEPGGVDERRALGHPTAVTNRVEVADVGAGVPLVARLGHQVVDPELAQPFGLGDVALEVEADAFGRVHQVLARHV